MRKMKAADKTLKDHEALEYSLMAKNMEKDINNKGFSSFQIVYGSNPKVPGITYGTPPSLSNEYKSVDIKKHIERLNSAREEFRRADIDEKIKRALKSRISSKSNELFQSGDRVFFKEKENDRYKEEWSGPAKIVGIDGKVLYLKYGNMLRRVHATKVVKQDNEYPTNESPTNIPTSPTNTPTTTDPLPTPTED